MRWPWSKRAETRNDLDTVIADAALDAAASGAPRADKLAVAQTAAGIIGRAFASATVEGEAGDLLPAPLRELIGRELILKGEILLVAGEDMSLLPCTSFDVRGMADPMTWTYRCDLSGPSRINYRYLPFSDVVHIRVNSAPSTPWRGRSVFSLASATTDTATRAEFSAGKEAKVSVSRLVPNPNRMNPDQRAQADDDFAASVAKGGYFTMSMTGQSGDRSRLSRPEVEAVHPDPTQGHVALRRESALDLLTAAGVPSALADPRAEAAARREGFRQLVHGTVEPLARVTETEIITKLGISCRFDFDKLFAADLAGRGRVLKQMVDAGVSIDRALETVGLG